MKKIYPAKIPIMHPLAPTDTESLDKVESKTPEIPENIYKKANFSIPSSVSS